MRYSCENIISPTNCQCYVFSEINLLLNLATFIEWKWNGSSFVNLKYKCDAHFCMQLWFCSFCIHITCVRRSINGLSSALIFHISICSHVYKSGHLLGRINGNNEISSNKILSEWQIYIALYCLLVWTYTTLSTHF